MAFQHLSAWQRSLLYKFYHATTAVHKSLAYKALWNERKAIQERLAAVASSLPYRPTAD